MVLLLHHHSKLIASHFFSYATTNSQPQNPSPKPSVSIAHLSLASSSSQSQNPPPKINPIAHYLTTCGLSSQKAIAASNKLPKHVSVEQAASVWHFFEQLPFPDTSIRKLVVKYPRIISYDVETTLEPNLLSLRQLGFTASELEQLIVSHAYMLVTPLAISRLKFWQEFLRTDKNRDIVLLITRNRGLITQDIASGVAPKIALLKKHGLSETEIIGIVKRGHGFIERGPEALEALLNRANALGFRACSPMFGQVLSALSSFGRGGSLEEKMELFKSFGWSNEDLLGALRKAPFLFHLTEENIRKKMEFLVSRAGCKQSYIASNPVLLMFSLERRLRPRQCILDVLKANGIERRLSLYSIMCLSEKKLLSSVILRWKERVPDIHEIYVAACAGQVPAE